MRWLEWAIVGGVYVGALAWITRAAVRKTTRVSDYVVGGRRLGPTTTALSAGASDMSGWLLLGLPGLAFHDLDSAIVLAIGLLAGNWLNWRLVARLLHARSVACDAETLPAFLAATLQGPAAGVREIAAFASLVFLVLYTAAGLFALSQLAATTFDIGYGTALVGATSLVVLYTASGGFLAVTWTDTAQAAAMLFVLMLCAAFVLWQSGPPPVPLFAGTSNAAASDRISLAVTLSSLAWGLGYFGQPHVLVRFMAIRRNEALVGARRIAIAWSGVGLASAIAIGSLAYGAFPTLDYSNPELVVIRIMDQLPGLLSSFAIVGVISAIMSTADSQLLVAATTVTQDLLRGRVGRNRLWPRRLTVVVIAVLAGLIAAQPGNSVLGLVGYAWAGFGAALGPAVLLSLRWPGTRSEGVAAGILTGLAVVIGWKQWLAEATGVYELLPAFTLSTLAVVGVSHLARRRLPAPNNC